MQAIYLETLDGQKKALNYHLHLISPKARLLRAARTLGLFFLLALGSILVPAVHFFSVPTLFIIGLIVAHKRWAQQAECDLDGHCPFCQAALHFEKLPMKAQSTEYCPQCRHQMRIYMQTDQLKLRCDTL